MAILLDWVRQTSTTTGTGAVVLGPAVAGFIRMQDDSRLLDGTQVYYTIQDNGNLERGIGTYTAAGPTLSRDVIFATLTNGTLTENPGTGLNLTGNQIITCSAVSNTHNFRGCYINRSTSYSLVDSTWTAIPFDTSSYDTDGFHSTTVNNSRITIPDGVSKARFTGQIDWQNVSTGDRRTCIYLNGAQTPFINILDVDSNLSHTNSIASPVIAVSSGDYYELWAFHNSGSAMTVSPTLGRTWFSMEVIE